MHILGIRGPQAHLVKIPRTLVYGKCIVNSWVSNLKNDKHGDLPNLPQTCLI